MNGKKQAIGKKTGIAGGSGRSGDAKRRGAARPKAEELRAALQSKAEQGQNSLGSLPVHDVKKRRKRYLSAWMMRPDAVVRRSPDFIEPVFILKGLLLSLAE
ncbi:MAG: hypothetical protein WAK31_07330 [Chthoniobacterales bacterium]